MSDPTVRKHTAGPRRSSGSAGTTMHGRMHGCTSGDPAAAHRAFFDAHAERWDDYITEEQRRKIRRLVVRFGIRPGDRVLDIGCGTGVLLPYLGRLAGPRGVVHAVDFAPRMITVARRKFGRRYRYTVADARRMPFPGGSFDVAVCYSVFPHFQDKPGTLAEIRRVLAPGGRIIVAHIDSRRSINTFHRSVHGVVRHDQMPAKRAMVRLLKNAGFVRVSVCDRPHSYIARGRIPASREFLHDAAVCCAGRGTA
jgi:ubiquinone/menaquinone biosynthesis C-methylase UbiE